MHEVVSLQALCKSLQERQAGERLWRHVCSQDCQTVPLIRTRPTITSQGIRKSSNVQDGQVMQVIIMQGFNYMTLYICTF